MFEKIKKWFKENTRSDIMEGLEEERKFLLDNAVEAEVNIKNKGWNILSRNTRVISYSYKIQKGNNIYEVSLREALKLK